MRMSGMDELLAELSDLAGGWSVRSLVGRGLAHG